MSRLQHGAPPDGSYSFVVYHPTIGVAHPITHPFRPRPIVSRSVEYMGAARQMFFLTQREQVERITKLGWVDITDAWFNTDESTDPDIDAGTPSDEPALQPEQEQEPAPDPADSILSPDMRTFLEVLAASSKPVKPKQIRAALDVNAGTWRALHREAVSVGYVKRVGAVPRVSYQITAEGRRALQG